MERSVIKDQRKDVFLSKNLTQEQKQEIAFYLNNPQFPMKDEIKKLLENKP